MDALHLLLTSEKETLIEHTHSTYKYICIILFYVFFHWWGNLYLGFIYIVCFSCYLSNLVFFFSMSLSILEAVCVHTPRYQRTTCKNSFFTLIMWFLRIIKPNIFFLHNLSCWSSKLCLAEDALLLKRRGEYFNNSGA